MSEEIKKVPVDIADKDLDEVAAGAPGDPVGGIDIGLRKRPAGQVTSTIPGPKAPVVKSGAGSGG